MERKGIGAAGLRVWGMAFVITGIISRSLLQNAMLGVGILSGAELVEVMQASESAMAVASMALIFQAIESCAVPVFAFLLAEGVRKTADLKGYVISLLATAVVAEIPYNLAMSRTAIDFATRNPAFGLVLGVVLLYLYQRFAGQKVICVVATIAGIAWAWMLSIDHGVGMVLLLAVIWLFREKALVRSFAGAITAMLCSLGSIFYMVAPMSFLLIHLYNGEDDGECRVGCMVCYPVVLLVIGFVGLFLF